MADIDIVEFLTKVKDQIEQEKAIMEKHNFVIDNLNDRWQKLVFTLYTDIAALSSEANQLLETMKETQEVTNG